MSVNAARTVRAPQADNRAEIAVKIEHGFAQPERGELVDHCERGPH
jgi:hypothetical protein